MATRSKAAGDSKRTVLCHMIGSQDKFMIDFLEGKASVPLRPHDN